MLFKNKENYNQLNNIYYLKEDWFEKKKIGEGWKPYPPNPHLTFPSNAYIIYSYKLRTQFVPYLQINI